MPKWIVPAFVAMVVVSLIPVGLIMHARSTQSPTPRINLVPDMDYQPKYLPQTENAMFSDGRAMRPEIAGTVARGQLRDDTRWWDGMEGGDWIAENPVPTTAAQLDRGRERYGIFCTPCHGIGGLGDGSTHQRALELGEKGLATWTPPTSMHDPLVVDRPDGHLFNSITYGIRSMPAYGSQIAPADRWAIVAHVRALQQLGPESAPAQPKLPPRAEDPKTVPAGADH